MKRKNLKYKGLTLVIGTATLLFGSIVYAGAGHESTDIDETEQAEAQQNDEVAFLPEGIDLKMGRATGIQTQAAGSEDNLDLAAGVGDLGEIGTGQEDAEINSLTNTVETTAGVEQVLANSNLIVDAETLAKIAEAESNHWGYQNLGIAHVDNHLNIREKPAEDGKLVGKLTKNAACEILDIDGIWAHIKSGKVEGYCSTEFLYTGDAAIDAGKKAAYMMAKVNTQTLKVREQPNTESPVITLIPEEEELEVVEVMDNGWIKFMLDEEEAYVSGEFVDVEERLEVASSLTELLYGQGVSDVRVSLVQFAKQYIGNPYVWGGTSLTNGADCSGFVLSVYKKYGISLPHHAASQAGYGKKVTLAEAQPGDLVFYAKNGSINHVAIYIGGGQVVHASSPKTGIKVSSVSYRTPATIRRILP